MSRTERTKMLKNYSGQRLLWVFQPCLCRGSSDGQSTLLILIGDRNNCQKRLFGSVEQSIMAPSGCNPLTLVVPFFSHLALMADVSTYSVKYLNVYEMDWLKSLARHVARAVTVSRWCSPMTMPWPSLHATMRFTVLIFTCWLVCHTKTTMNIHDLWVSAQNRTHLLLVQTWMNGEIQECLDLNEKDKVVFLSTIWLELKLWWSSYGWFKA